MDNEQIYQIMFNKVPNNNKNIYYLSKYLKFISKCIEHNKKISNKVYVENHHILPKSKYFWPEYESFKYFPWNKAKLSARQHYIAHVMLSKTYGGPMWCALSMFIKRSPNGDGVNITPSMYETIRTNHAKFMRDRNRKNRKANNKELLTALIMNSNHPHYETTKIRWVNDGTTELMTNLFYLPDNVKSGRIDSMKQITKNNLLSSKGRVWVNNGFESFLIDSTNIPENLSLGRLKINILNPHDRSGKNNNAYGKKWFNDGEKTLLVYESDAPKGFVLGMLDSHKQKLNKGSNELYNNGENQIRIYDGGIVPEGYCRGSLKIECPHCGKMVSINNAKRYHLENCPEY